MFFLFINNASIAQDKTLPVEAKSFVPAGYELLDYIKGDISGDSRSDAIMILKQVGEDTAIDELKRLMILLIRISNGKLRQVARNDNAILCRQCGGVFGDPYEGVITKSSAFEISFYGGSSWRWADTYSFVYKRAQNNWYLVKEKHLSFQSGDPEATTKQTTITAAELGEIPFEKFNSVPGWEDSKWKVLREKAYFYDSPVLGSKPRKAYVLKGNVVTAIRQLKNFIEVSYQNDAEEATDGYILRKDLQLQK